MKAGDLVELLDPSDESPGAASGASRDVQLLYGRNEATGKRGAFSNAAVYVLPTVDRPTTDFVVSLAVSIRRACVTLCCKQHVTQDRLCATVYRLL